MWFYQVYLCPAEISQYPVLETAQLILAWQEERLLAPLPLHAPVVKAG